MKRFLLPLLMLSMLALTACTRTAVSTATASPTAQATATPELQTAIPDLPDVQLNQPDNTLPAGSSQPLKDGVYAAEMSDTYVENQGHGWQDYLKMTVTNGQIAHIEFDSLKDGQKKSAVSTEEYPMNPPASEWIPKLNEAIRTAQMPEAMDTISGATMSSVNARRMYAALLEHAQTGNTDIVILDAE